MLFNSIDFPHEIIKAARENRLVVFAGAGVSVGSPTNFPGFSDLIEEIYYDKYGTNIKKDKEDRFPADIYAGDLERKGVDIHNRVANKLSSRDAKPNDLHKSILRLYSNKKIRIVTTNFDVMFEEAFGEDERVCIYNAPALPDGSDFSGIVHIHGNVNDPKHIIITDSDFGKAYITDGYVVRFLTKVFRSYTVLFVGYSYNDILMNYFTKAIPKEEKENSFIITNDADNDWKMIGIEPVRYEKDDPNHKQLHIGFEMFSDYCCRSLIDLDEKIQYVASNEPPCSKDEVSFILELLSEPNTAKLFLNRAEHENWFGFMSANGLIDNLFRNESSLSDVECEMVHWICRHSLNEQLLLAIEMHNNTINPLFERELLWSISSLDGELFKIYVVSFLPRITNGVTLSHILDRSIDLQEDCLSVRIFRKMLHPSIIIKKGWGYYSDKTRVELSSEFERGSCFCIDWRRLKDSIINKELYNLLLSEATLSIKDLYDTGKIIDNPSIYSTFLLDYISIDSCSDDKVESVICDVIITSLNKLADSALSVAWINEQLKSEIVLLKRLAVRHLEMSTFISSDIKCNIILGIDDYVEPFVGHEIVFLLRMVFRELSDSLTKPIVDSIKRQFYSGNYEKRIELLNLIFWITDVNAIASENDYLKRCRDELCNIYPDFCPIKCPERNTDYGEVIVSDGIDSRLVSRIVMHDYDELDSIIDQSKKEFHLDDYDVGSSIRKAASDNPSWATKCILDLIENRCDFECLPELVQGIDFSSDYSRVDELFEGISSKKTPSVIAKDLSLLLSDYIRSFDRVEPLICDRIMAYLSFVWDLEHEVESDSGSSFTKSFNSSRGTVAFSLAILVSKCEQRRDVIINQIKEMMRENYDEFNSIIVGQSAFFFGINSFWTETELLPHLRRDNCNDYPLYWESLLTMSNTLYFDYVHVIKPYYDEAVGLSNEFEDRVKYSLARHYSILVAFESVNALSDAIGFIRLTDSKSNEVFLDGIGSLLRKKTTELKRKEIWDKWLKVFVEKRIDNIPKSLTSDEAGAVLAWTKHIHYDGFGELVELITRFEVMDSNAGAFFLHDIDKYDNFKRQIKPTIMLLEYLSNMRISFIYDRNSIDRLHKIWLENGIEPDDEKKIEDIMLKAKNGIT